MIRGAVAAAVAAVAVTAAAAAPPKAGLLVPGESLGGIRLGATKDQVRRAWGTNFGLCRSCKHLTWYWNYAPSTPQGAGVEFRGGRVAAVFTLWKPAYWRTPERLRVGDPAGKVTRLYGALPRRDCGDYDVLTLVAPRAVTAFYLLNESVWGFGLARPGVPACR